MATLNLTVRFWPRAMQLKQFQFAVKLTINQVFFLKCSQCKSEECRSNEQPVFVIFSDIFFNLLTHLLLYLLLLSTHTYFKIFVCLLPQSITSISFGFGVEATVVKII